MTSTLTLASKRHRRPSFQAKALGEAVAVVAAVAAAGAAVVGAAEVAADAVGALSAAAAGKVSSACVQLHVRPHMAEELLRQRACQPLNDKVWT